MGVVFPFQRRKQGWMGGLKYVAKLDMEKAPPKEQNFFKCVGGPKKICRWKIFFNARLLLSGNTSVGVSLSLKMI